MRPAAARVEAAARPAPAAEAQEDLLARPVERPAQDGAQRCARPTRVRPGPSSTRPGVPRPSPLDLVHPPRTFYPPRRGPTHPSGLCPPRPGPSTTRPRLPTRPSGPCPPAPDHHSPALAFLHPPRTSILPPRQLHLSGRPLKRRNDVRPDRHAVRDDDLDRRRECRKRPEMHRERQPQSLLSLRT